MNNLRKYLEEGRIIRNKWFDTDEQGRETACLYAAITGSDKPEDCPSEVMPKWMAYLTPWIDDAGSEEHWPEVIKRYADLQERWHVLSDEDWQWLEYKVKLIAVREAKKYAGQCLEVVERVEGLLDRALNGDVPDEKEWQDAESDAWSARSARSAARSAAWSAAESTWSAAKSARSAESAADRMIDQILDAIEEKVKEKDEVKSE